MDITNIRHEILKIKLLEIKEIINLKAPAVYPRAPRLHNVPDNLFHENNHTMDIEDTTYGGGNNITKFIIKTT